MSETFYGGGSAWRKKLPIRTRTLLSGSHDILYVRTGPRDKQLMSIERRDYAGWPDSWWLGNGEVELVVPSQIGPRVIRYGRVGGPNLFHNFAHADRKSTRLNSSHLGISYAVFC